MVVKSWEGKDYSSGKRGIVMVADLKDVNWLLVVREVECFDIDLFWFNICVIECIDFVL